MPAAQRLVCLGRYGCGSIRPVELWSWGLRYQQCRGYVAPWTYYSHDNAVLERADKSALAASCGPDAPRRLYLIYKARQARLPRISWPSLKGNVGRADALYIFKATTPERLSADGFPGGSLSPRLIAVAGTPTKQAVQLSQRQATRSSPRRVSSQNECRRSTHGLERAGCEP